MRGVETRLPIYLPTLPFVYRVLMALCVLSGQHDDWSGLRAITLQIVDKGSLGCRMIVDLDMMSMHTTHTLSRPMLATTFQRLHRRAARQMEVLSLAELRANLPQDFAM